MSEYSNSPIPEGTNQTRFPWGRFVAVAVLLLGLLTLFLIGSFQVGAYAMRFIPFEVERYFADLVPLEVVGLHESTPALREAEVYIQSIADQVLEVQQAPTDIRVQVHLVPGDTVNAMATLGGHLLFYEGLLTKLESENALTMLVAHEVAHVVHRDPARSVGGYLIAGTALEWVTGGSGLGAALIGEQTAQLVLLGFSRDQEMMADRFAVEAVEKIYGHTTDVDQLFKVLLMEVPSSESVASLWSSHPKTQARIDRLPRDSGGEVTPLKVDFKQAFLKAGSQSPGSG